ncbi:MAG: fused MFS/spermidine synthase [Verrucomicrobia bacterium]|nr:fused MFS/spermidine synthase [Verrucomicrobiota bacterium]
MTAPNHVDRRLVLAAIAALGVASVMTQLALMRELLGAFSGNEITLGVTLGNWLLLTGLGSWLGRGTGRLREPVPWLAGGLIAVAALPLAQVFLLRALRNVVFLRGSTVGVTETVLGSLVLLAPFCIVSGWLLTLACVILGQREGATGIGRVYVADSAGSIAGGALFSFVMVRLLDHLAILYAPALLSLAVAAVIAWRIGSKRLVVAASAFAVAISAAAFLADADAVSTALQFPHQKIVFRQNSPYGKLVVTESPGQFNFIENGVPFVSTHNVGQVEETVHYAMIQRPEARRVLLVGGGISGTAREILKYGVAEVTYVELDPLIIAAGRRFLPDALADARIRVVQSDGRLFIKQTAERFDVVIVDAPDPSTSQINRFYTAEFFAEAKRALATGGVLSFGLGRYENYVSPELGRLLASAHATLRRSFANVLMIPGGRVFFLASDGPLHADIAARIAQRGVPTRLVKAAYLDAMLTPDRMADLARAVAQPAAVNTDFNPALYLYHLRHWASQFRVRFGWLGWLLVAALAIYMARLRPASLAIFASGFAGSALEVVLLLGFQAMCGSLYQQIGVIVTMFMAGLAAGAWLANRRSGASSRGLALLAFVIASFAALLPLALTTLGGASVTATQAVVALLTFALAALVGMEFPLASRAQFEGAAATASRLYTADFVGAFLGALLPSVVLIPLIGVTAVCWLTAGLNAAAGVVILLRKG